MSNYITDVLQRVQYQLGNIQLITTLLLPFEVVNGMYAATLSKRVTVSVAEKLIESFLQLPLKQEDISYQQAFSLAKQHRISVYDASYLALAKQKQLSLLSLDKRLKKLVD